MISYSFEKMFSIGFDIFSETIKKLLILRRFSCKNNESLISQKSGYAPRTREKYGVFIF